MSGVTIARKVRGLQKRLVKRLNDVHIFVNQALPLLVDARDSYKAAEQTRDRRYYVPSIKKRKFARRNDAELIAIYDRFIDRELFENLIVTAVSQIESFIFDVLKQVIMTYPNKLTLNVRGVDVPRQVPIEIVLETSDRDEMLRVFTERHLHSVSYKPPKTHLEYFGKIAGVDVSNPIFEDYIEIKATRDLIVHNSGIVNDVYLEKAGDKGRSECDELIPVDEDYFDHCIATLKDLSRIIAEGIEITWSKI